MKILVVDDEELIRNVIKEYLLQDNFEGEEASDETEAIEKVKESDYNLIILDIMMPKKDIYQIVREIKNIKDIPVSNIVYVNNMSKYVNMKDKFNNCMGVERNCFLSLFVL